MHNKLKKLAQLFLSAMSISLPIIAQQDAQYSMYFFNTLAVNPAYAGTRDALTLNLLNRNQWIGYPGAPVTQTFSAHSPVLGNMGAGISLLNDRIGPLRNTGANISLSYRLKFKKSYLSFGVTAGGDMITGSLSTLHTTQSSDPNFSNDVRTNFLPNFGTGIYYYSDHFYLGASIPRSLSNRFWKVSNPSATAASRQQVHYFFIAGFITKISNDLKFKPSLQTKITEGAPIQIDINANFLIREKVYLGPFYRLNDAVGFMLQYNFTDQLRGAFAWDQTISSLRSYNNGSLELGVSYDFIFKKNNIKSPRYF